MTDVYQLLQVCCFRCGLYFLPLSI